MERSGKWGVLGRRLLGAAIASALITGFCVFGYFVAAPMHRDGRGQKVFWAVNAVADLVTAPVRFALPSVAGALGRDWRVWQMKPVLTGTAAFYFLLFALLDVRLGSRRQTTDGASLSPDDRELDSGAESSETRDSGLAAGEPANDEEALNATAAESVGTSPLSRRAFFAASAGRVAKVTVVAVGGSALAWSVLAEPNFLPVVRRKLRLAGLPASLDGLRAVYLSDIHHGPWLSVAFLRRMVERVNALRPDLILLGGDYVNASPDYIKPAFAEMAALRANIGVAGVLGNHDWWEDAPRTRKQFEKCGFALVDNARVFVTPGRRMEKGADAGLCVAGVGDFWEDKVDAGAALHKVPREMPRLLLSHNPDVAMEPQIAQGGHRIDMMLSGHTHGGQIRIPFLGTPIVPSNYGQKFAAGLVDTPGCPVYVSRGVGYTVLPLRFGVPPEITLWELESAPQRPMLGSV
ncbi:MAG: metallophosphoesterase [Candidatus Sumerlaeaceae bacterium]|nr:metallophosphoesterase [Candidatus Sumerlaeaceae bacterium]